MQKIRLIIPIFLLILGGCDQEKIAQLDSENRELRAKIADYDQKTQLELAKNEHSASIYNACSAFYGVGEGFCPGEALKNGQKAVSEGFSGAGWVFWCVVFGKMSAMGGFVAALAFGLWYLVKKKILPDFERAEAAEKLVMEAESRVAAAKIEERILNSNLNEARRNLAELTDLAEEKQNELREIFDKKQLIEAQIKAKSLFDKI